jgi:hypothetical protein
MPRADLSSTAGLAERLDGACLQRKCAIHISGANGELDSSLTQYKYASRRLPFDKQHGTLGIRHRILNGFKSLRGFDISAGAVFGSQTILPSTFAYTPGSYASVNPSIPTSTKFKPGFFFMIGFDTSLFGQIFNGSIFQSVLSIGTAGSPPAPAPAPTAPTQ